MTHLRQRRRMRHRQRPLALALVLAAAVLPVACGGGGDSASTASATAGSSGADTTGGAAAAMSIASDDGLLTLDVPAGAVPAGTAITVTAVDGPDGTFTYDLQPDGLQFATPATATFDATPSLDLGAIVAWSATLTSAEGTTEQLALDPADDGTLTAEIPHFSEFKVATDVDLVSPNSWEEVGTVTAAVGETAPLPLVTDPNFQVQRLISDNTVFNFDFQARTVTCMAAGSGQVWQFGKYRAAGSDAPTWTMAFSVGIVCVEPPTSQPVTLGDAWGADLKLEGTSTFEIVDGNVVFSFGPDVTGLATAGTVGLQTPLVGGGYFNCYAPYDQSGVAEMSTFEPGKGGCELLGPDYSVRDRFPIDVTLDEGVLSMSIPYGPNINGTTPDMFFAGPEGAARQAVAETTIEWLLRVFGPTYVTFYANDGSGVRASAQIDPLPSYLCPLATDDSLLDQGCAGG